MHAPLQYLAIGIELAFLSFAVRDAVVLPGVTRQPPLLLGALGEPTFFRVRVPPSAQRTGNALAYMDA